jgi:signal transduction histidine kinase
MDSHAHSLENAAQYSPAGSSIRPDLPHLFERFYHGAIGRRLRSGTGVGLWITARLLAAQDGRVWAENCPDGGSRFTIVTGRKT